MQLPILPNKPKDIELHTITILSWFENSWYYSWYRSSYKCSVPAVEKSLIYFPLICARPQEILVYGMNLHPSYPDTITTIITITTIATITTTTTWPLTTNFVGSFDRWIHLIVFCKTFCYNFWKSPHYWFIYFQYCKIYICLDRKCQYITWMQISMKNHLLSGKTIDFLRKK